MHIPITNEEAKRKAIFAGKNDAPKSIAMQRAVVIPPPATLLVLIVITTFHHLQPIHGMIFPPHISQQQSAQISV